MKGANMKKLSIILLVAGILVAAIPLLGQLYNSYKEDRMVQEWLESEDTSAFAQQPDQDIDETERISALNEAFASEKDDSSDSDSSPDNWIDKDQQQDTSGIGTGQTVLGVIKIKKIKVSVPVVEGVSNSNLKVGVGHVPGTAGFGQPGNCALAGHRSYTFGKYFNRLDELETGDEILLITKSRQYRYKVYDTKVVLPSDVSVLKGDMEDSILTLITCTPIYVASHRLIVNARLEGTYISSP
jgi:sortase A